MNANDVYEIDRFDTWDMRGVPVTKEDNVKYYAHFDHIMSHYWQEEILGVPVCVVCGSGVQAYMCGIHCDTRIA